MLLSTMLAAAAVTALLSTMAHPAQAEQIEQDALEVELELNDSGFEASALRAAIARELGVAVVEATGDGKARARLRVEFASQTQATVSFQTPDGRSVGRSIELPAQRERALETIALLAANLARNEAAELIRELERRMAAARASVEEPPPVAADADKPVPQPSAPQKPPKRAAAQPKPQPKAPPKVELDDSASINLSLFHPFSLFHDSHRRQFNLELGLLYGRIGGLRGAGVNAIVERIDHQLRGVQLSGFGTWVGGDSAGVVASGFGNVAQGRFRGVQAAGFANAHVGRRQHAFPFDLRQGASLTGVQVAGGYNYVAGSVRGVQAAGGANVMLGEVEGGQIAG